MRGVRTAEAEQRRIERNADVRRAGRDIAASFRYGFAADGHPMPGDAERRKRHADDYVAFLSWAFPAVFFRPFSDGQLEDLALMSGAIREGGQFAFAAPRKDGKTSRVVGMGIWALLYGYRRFGVVVGSDLGAARDEILGAIKLHLRSNQMLISDYPEVCIPAMQCDDVAARAKLFTVNGQHLRFTWSRDLVILPTWDTSPSSGSILMPRGLTGRLRGIFHATEEGEHLRPDLFLLDDPQTDESARSPKQCDDREKLIMGAVLGAGGDVPPAALLPGTIIEPNDLVFRFLDHSLHPEFLGRRRAMVKSWPDAQDTLWAKYHELRKSGLVEGDGGKAAQEFYADNRVPMDAGAVVDDDNRMFPGELSALQHAENILCDRGKGVFFAEYQNDPQSAVSTAYEITPELVSGRLNGFPTRKAPDDAPFLGCHVDINHYGMHWTIVASQNNMTGYVVDYGRYPEGRPLVEKGSNASEIATAVYEGLTTLAKAFSDFQIKRKAATGPMDLVLIDCGYQMEVVCQWVKHARYPFRCLPSWGIAETKYHVRKPIGAPRDHCHLSDVTNKGHMLLHNSDYWREATQRAFLSPVGAPGSLSIYGTDQQHHTTFARHICAEFLIEHISGQSGEFYKWGHTPGEIWDWLDSTVGAFMATCMLGASFGGVVMPTKKVKRKRRKSKVERRD